MIPEWNDRRQAHIQTDKVVYRPLDVMFIEVFVVDAFTKKPLTAEQWTWTSISLDVMDGTDTLVHSDSTATMSASSYAFTYKLPEDAPGGEYLIKTSGRSVACSTRLVRVRDYDRQQLVVQTEWDRDSYFPEETVFGTITVTPSDGYKFETAPTIDYSLDFGDLSIPVEVTGKKLDIDTNSYRVSFEVPPETDLQYVTMMIAIDTGSIQQTASKVLVIGQPDKMYLEFFPETNYIVNDVQNRIFFQAWVNDQMAELVDFGKGNLIDQDGVVVASDIGTFHRGKGVFLFTPEQGKSYTLDFNLGGAKGRVQKKLPEVQQWMQTNVNFQMSKNVLENKDDLTIIFQSNDQVDSGSVFQFSI